MLDTQILAFTAVAAVLAVTPGADTLLVIKNSARDGAHAGLATTAGVLCGVLMHALISALGISAVVARSEWVFQLLKALGALYLVWLGIQTLRAAGHVGVPASLPRGTSVRSGFYEGLVSNALNPKVAVFYIAFLPQFIRVGDPVLAKSLLLSAIHIAFGLIWLAALSLAVGRGRDWIHQRHVQQWLQRISGAMLIGLGVRLALESR